MLSARPSPLRSPEDGSRIPSEFEEYRLVRPLGRGTAGVVYLAHDTLLDRPVSIKFLPRVNDAASLARFLSEARAAARVTHPNVATLFRVGQLDGRPYLVSEFVRGVSLDQHPKPVPWATALRYGRDLARGLGAAHRRGVLHRDIKPANAVLTESDEVKLLDFGLAKVTDGARFGPGLELDPELMGPTSEQAGVGAMIGTPYYMAPEVWQGEEASPRSDLYSLGALLYELCTGCRPSEATDPEDLFEALRAGEVVPVRDRNPAVDPRFAAAIERCLKRDPADRHHSAEELLEALEIAGARDEDPTALPPQGNPYRSLQAFEPEHRAVFFGRRREIASALERMRSESFLLLTGDSGVGKSSLALAGILSAVREGALCDQRAWQCARLVPGQRPVTALTSALASALGVSESLVDSMASQEPESFGRSLRARLGPRGLVVYIDQFEELITASPPQEANRTASLLAPLAAGIPGVRLLASARSDFLTRLAALPGLGEHLSRALFLVRPLSPEETREAIVGPARVGKGQFESEALVDELVRSAATLQGGLPLLQFALAELWEARDRESGTISASTLEAIGGVSGALARHAEAVLAGMLPQQRNAARALLLRLVSPDGTRIRRTARELGSDDPARYQVLEALVRGRILVARESEGETTYEIAHEALLQGWGTLARWVGDAAESRAHRDRLAAAALEWERVRFAPDALWSRRQLEEVRKLQLDELSMRERAFLRASRRAVYRRQMIIAGAVIAFLAAVLGTWLLVRTGMNRQRDEALAQHLGQAQQSLAEARDRAGEVDALRREAFLRFDSRDRDGGERLWRKSRHLDSQAEHAFVEANDHFEKAVVLGRNDPAIGRPFAELLLERARRAERSGRGDVVELFLQRLRAHDASGKIERSWNQPVRLDLTSDPPGAEVTVERYDPDADGRLRAVAEPRLRSTPLIEEFAPGSWRLTLKYPGRETIRFPILLQRGERRTVRLRLPLTSEVPAHFVYVPAGTSLFGSAEDESIREFFNTLPLHTVETPGFLIARTETTFADWIAYSESLPGTERRTRAPRSSSTGMFGSLQLDATPSGWRLRMKPTSKVYEAKHGEKIRYQARRLRSEQDWLRFPVSGISFDDAIAYVRWLDRTRRVPGARLCNEHEWERAARGADARLYPHGNRLEPDDANFDRTYLKDPLAFGPDEVGSHPASRSPFDVDDLAGNVWEWVYSSVTAEEAAARGGSFYFDGTSARANNRQVPERTFRDLGVGLRVCATPQF
jgi:serine/threonine protein kinase/formylglycine-generating enzyme required for sulfatase activity